MRVDLFTTEECHAQIKTSRPMVHIQWSSIQRELYVTESRLIRITCYVVRLHADTAADDLKGDLPVCV